MYSTSRFFRLLYRNLNKPRFFSIDSETVFNEVNIPMIDRRLQKQLFSKSIASYKLSKEACQQLEVHGINAFDRKNVDEPQYIELPQFQGSNIKQHFDSIATDLSKPYIDLIRQIQSIPEIPTKWQMIPGWTAYADGSYLKVDSPKEDVFIFDTEVLVTESCAPVIAVAASPKAWYLWVSPRLFSSSKPLKHVSLNELIPFYSNPAEFSKSKCVIGHFVSYDRARIMEEYLTEVIRLSS